MIAPVGRRLLLGYAIGSLGTGVYLTVPSVLLLYFLTDILEIPSGFAALTIFAPKLVGAALDPVVGWLSDRTRSRLGRRRPWLLAGALGMGIAFVLLFRVPMFESATGRFGYVLAMFLASAIFYSLFAVPYIAMSAEMSADPNERTRIVAWRMSFVMGGIILGAAVAPLLVSTFGGGRAGYGTMSLIVGAVSAVAMLTAFAATAAAPARAVPQKSRPLVEQLAVPLGDPAFRRLTCVFVLQTCVFGLVGAFLPYAASRLLKADEGLVGILLLALLGASLVCMRPWAMLAARWGSRRALVAASAAHGVLALTLLGLGEGYPVPLLILQFAALGIAYAGLQLLPFAMLTDVIEQDRLTSGQSREGAYTGLWTAAEKIGLAAGPAIAAGLLALFQYRPDAPVGGATADLIRYAMALAPAAIQLLSILLLVGYPAASVVDASRLCSTGGR